MPLAAVLWDLDGTLVDTEPQWMAAEFRLATRHGAAWSVADGLAMVGRDLLSSGAYIRARMGLTLSPEAIVSELLDDMVTAVASGVTFRPGARRLLDELHSCQVPCALVTMSFRRMVEPILAQLPSGSFAAVVTGDEVRNGKPHPEPYLRALRQLRVNPSRCVAIEDSSVGATSAEAAGVHVLVAPSALAVPGGPRRTLVTDLNEVDTALLTALATGPATP